METKIMECAFRIPKREYNTCASVLEIIVKLTIISFTTPNTIDTRKIRPMILEVVISILNLFDL